MSMTPLKRKNPASDKDLLDAYNAIQGTLLFSYRSSALCPFQHPKICRYIPTPGLTPRFPYSDRLLRVKPKLASTLSSDSSELLIGLFNEIASLAASILLLKQSGNKASTGKAWTDVTDFLDREGVNLWNTSNQFRTELSHSNDPNLFAAGMFSSEKIPETSAIYAHPYDPSGA
ncbi:hypothetical protein SISSUDRAFT_167787 [Sistotremastrum suecicum HHB10207 ss-3]|uniref:Uncharacterized protein n=1 Tax=Sistotremastrum suecicum HHB10207 ss-3 TaxID=1314776 RepID=A0A166AL96_9AGAM|nr:hypothetical protein SISSUDRAFT_167787 [Sistotremastrum suecicum HHB10207 ss-3]